VHSAAELGEGIPVFLGAPASTPASFLLVDSVSV
jgi:hypothetical protein